MKSETRIITVALASLLLCLQVGGSSKSPTIKAKPVTHKQAATVKLLHSHIKLGMTNAAVDKALAGLTFRHKEHIYTNAGPEGWHQDIDYYYCSDGMVEVGYEFAAYGKTGEAAHVVAISGNSVNTGFHFYEGDGQVL